MPKTKPKLNTVLDDTGEYIRVESQKMVYDHAIRFVKRLRAANPVITGRMRRSWIVSRNSNGDIIVTNTAPYAVSVLTKLFNQQRRILRKVWDRG